MSWHKASEKWETRLTYTGPNGKNYFSCGFFKDEVAAARAVNECIRGHPDKFDAKKMNVLP